MNDQNIKNQKGEKANTPRKQYTKPKFETHQPLEKATAYVYYYYKYIF